MRHGLDYEDLARARNVMWFVIWNQHKVDSKNRVRVHIVHIVHM